MVQLIGRGSPVVALSGFFLCLSLSSRRSSDRMEGVGCQNWARGRIPIFRKINLYGKMTKSTHGHTKKKPTQPVFSDLALFRLPRLPWSKKRLPCGRKQLPCGRKHLPYSKKHLPYSKKNTYPVVKDTYPVVKDTCFMAKSTYPAVVENAYPVKAYFIERKRKRKDICSIKAYPVKACLVSLGEEELY